MNIVYNFTLVVAALAGASSAHSQTLTAGDPELIADLLRAEGYRAEIVPAKKPDAAPSIRSGAGGATFTIFFYDCTKGKDCKAVQYYAGFTGTKMDAARMNAWNLDRRFTRAYIDNENDPVLEMDVNMAPEGLPRALFIDNLEVWASQVGQFRTFVFAD